MRGKRKPICIPMRHYPFTLLRIRLYNTKGKLAYSNLLLLLGIGEKHIALRPLDSYLACNQRYDVEHFIRFGKQRLLLNGFQTSGLQHEEDRQSLTHLAYL